VMGPFTEYASLMFALCMSEAYIRLYVLSVLFSILFLGGWNPLVWPFNVLPFLPSVELFVKGVIVMLAAVFLRSVYPRYRIDQAIRAGWHYLFVISMISVVLSLMIRGMV